MKITLRTYREGKRWFFDDTSKDIKHEEFVQGTPEILEALAGDKKVKVIDVTFSPSSFQGATECALVDDKVEEGVLYMTEIDGRYHEGWLCPVFWQYFKTAPARLFVRVDIVE